MESVLIDEEKIAKFRAALLDKLSNWGEYSTADGYEYGGENVEYEWLEAKTKELAMSRAAAQKRDFNAVLNEVELRVTFHLATFLAQTALDPAAMGTTLVTIQEDDHVCGVCQEGMERGDQARAMDCMHAFHETCILEWLHLKNTCPLCRHVMVVPKQIRIPNLS